MLGMIFMNITVGTALVGVPHKAGNLDTLLLHGR